jgi:hypothetical protein
MGRLSEDDVARNSELVTKLIGTFPKLRQEAVLEMFKGTVGVEYMTAPASHREDYHNAFPGGLAEHSLRVVRNLRALVTAWGVQEYAIDIPRLNFVGLFHDLGKVGDGVEPYYLANADDWQRKRGIFYNFNPKCTFMPSGERSLFVLQKYGIVLRPDEYLALRLADGQYDETNARYSMKEPDLALLLHMADRWACAQEKLLL